MANALYPAYKAALLDKIAAFAEGRDTDGEIPPRAQRALCAAAEPVGYGRRTGGLKTPAGLRY